MKTRETPLVPPATLGLLGGGQLGRMTALAAKSAGYHVHAMDPDPHCAIRPLADDFTTAGWSDVAAATNLAKNSDVVTFEIERVSVAALEAAGRLAPVRPGPEVLCLVQNRVRQKSWLHRHGFPVGRFAVARSPEELLRAVRDLGPCFIKTAEGGYDGRGQLRLRDVNEAEHGWDVLSSPEVIAEKALALQYELSVLVSRRPSGEIRVYPPAMNYHENQILAWSVMPAPIEPGISLQAQDLAQELAIALALEGLLVVEMFVTTDGQLLVNEMAPRPHNSYHASERACVTGQFEQLVRAVCNLPLGSSEVVRPTAIVNLLGELWTGTTPEDVAASLEVPESRIHWYGKSQVRPGRKMGHLSAAGSTADEALKRAVQAKAILGRRRSDSRPDPGTSPLQQILTGPR